MTNRCDNCAHWATGGLRMTGHCPEQTQRRGGSVTTTHDFVCEFWKGRNLDKETCPHCGAVYRIVGYFGPDLIPIRQWACQSNPNKQSEYCKLRVAAKESARAYHLAKGALRAGAMLAAFCGEEMDKLEKAVQDGN